MSEIDNNSTAFSSFVKNIETRISKLTTLEIKTIIGDYELNENEVISHKKDGDFKIMQSRIDLIEGDITTNISEELVTDKFAWLREFHARKEEKGHEIIDGNIKAIVSLFDLYRKTRNFKFNEEDVDETETEAL